MTTSSQPPLVFTASITGHRMLAPDSGPLIEAEIAAILTQTATQLRKRAATSPLDAGRPLELRFLTALAEGADQVGARAALSDAARAAGWQCDAVLPFAASDYPGTMLDGTGLAELWPQMDRTLELADLDPGPQGDPRAEHWRARRYAAVGQMLVRRADLVIAVWRGTPPEGRGGTADVISDARRSGVPIVWIDPGPADALHAPTAQAILPDQATSHLPMLAIALDRGPPVADAITMAIDNVLIGTDPASAGEAAAWLARARVVRWRVADRANPVQAGTSAAPYGLLLDTALIGSPDRRRGAFRLGWRQAGWWRWLPNPLVQTAFYQWDIDGADPGSSAIDRPLAAPAIHADAVATRLGHHYRSAYVAIFLLAGLAVALALMFLFAKGLKPVFVMAELAVIALAWLIYRRTSPSGIDSHRRWIDARLIAESLRGLRLLAWIGFSGRRPVMTAPPPDHGEADHGHAPPRPIWAPHWVNGLAALPPLPQGRMDAARIAAIAADLAAVIEDQRAYHDRNYHRLSSFHHRLDRIGVAMVLASAAASLAYLAAAAAETAPLASLGWSGGIAAHYSKLSALAAFLGGVGPALAAALMGIRYHGDFERFANRSLDSVRELTVLGVQATTLRDEAAHFANSEKPPRMPLFEQLLGLALETQATLDDDLADWRFAYAARPVPLPG
jgi:hypothetical protein